MSKVVADEYAGLGQFELLDNEFTRGAEIEFIWVDPIAVQAIGSHRYPGCKCKIRYRVAEEHLPSRWRDHQNYRRSVLNTSAPTYVCACVGKLIE